ncbi:hypothetical protein HCN44_007045 [Aphidius gifuensis]|uniref:Lipid droplet-associated hydrolase n=1 Tax=Aphidius gifuensis TaxID=684658 RepID=A0A834XYI3_APHGI|nr:lipid droplet-associated hydrolase [Aphidius gifuensis]XP_044004289.1 lipid droplet-associated hydrolase [Aphidius gifuensis]KAF7995938.1 hypothetical protein HCN44_007045 [Aphidius gifuensis]
MHQAMLCCNGVQTQIITEGRWVEEGLASSGKKDLVLVIPGNPGVPGFYKKFIKYVKLQLPTEVPVWVVGHAGHVQPPKHLAFSSSESSHNNLFNLNGQLRHKIEFIKEYVPKDAKLHIVCHSIGSWFALKLLEDEELAKQVVKCYLLFPTIEYLAETPSGTFLNTFLPILSPFLVLFAWIFSFFSKFIQRILILIFGLFFGVTSESVDPVLHLLNPLVLNRVFKLAIEELKTVREINHNVIEKYPKKLFLYYGASDGWTPITYYERFKNKFPSVDVELCSRGFRHAFVLTDAKGVGLMIGNMINKTIE